MALALLLNVPAVIAGKPTRSLPRPSASRSAGPESLARAGRRQGTRTEARGRKSNSSPKSAKEARRKGKASPHESSRHNRREAAREEAATANTRDVATRSRRSSRRSRKLAREEQSRTAVATADQPTRSERRKQIRAAEFSVRATEQPSRADDARDSNLTALDAQQAFGSLSPLKSIEQEAARPVLLPTVRVASLYDSRGRLMIPAPLYGSHEILLHQNEMADRDGLDRVRDDAGLEELLREKKLVALPASEMLEVDDRLPSNRRYSRPWTAAFLSVLSHDYYANFHEPLYVTSAVRTVQVQQRLVRTNGNAAGVSGDSASPHLTGQAVDIAKKGLSMPEIAWLRTYLQPLIGDGKIDVEEEFRQACFHISVYRSYLPMSAPRLSVAASRPASGEVHP